MPALASLVFLTPWAALVALAFLLPVAALVLRERREARARAALGLAGPGARGPLLRGLGLLAVAALVGATAAQPALRDVGGEPMRTDAEVYLTFDVSRSMLATTSPGERNRLDRAIAFAGRVHESLRDVPTGVATVTNRMMPLLFPIADGRGVTAVLRSSVAVGQPAPSRLTTPRATQLGALSLTAHRTYFSRSARTRALVVLSDLDTDEFGLDGTLAALHRARIEPYLVRIARPGERIFDARGRAEPYRSTSTLAVSRLRAAGWHAYEESELDRLVADVQTQLGDGPTRPSGVVEAQRSIAPLVGIAALAVVALLTVPSLLAGLGLARA
jgi:hypothetical protein